MAERYWVGNTGMWTDTSHWSATSGGAGGASVPTADDDVVIDESSFSLAGQYIIFPIVVAPIVLGIPLPDYELAVSTIDETPVTEGIAADAIPVPTVSTPISHVYETVGTCTFTIASPGIVTTSTAHGLTSNQGVAFTSTGALPTEIITMRQYYASVIDDTTFNLMVIPSGYLMDLTGTPSGTHTIVKEA